MFWWPRFHKHTFTERYGGRDAQGAITELWWECPCGYLSNTCREARARASATQKLYDAMKKDTTP